VRLSSAQTAGLQLFAIRVEVWHVKGAVISSVENAPSLAAASKNARFAHQCSAYVVCKSVKNVVMKFAKLLVAKHAQSVRNANVITVILRIVYVSNARPMSGCSVLFAVFVHMRSV
jgi:hypothetical protein